MNNSHCALMHVFLLTSALHAIGCGGSSSDSDVSRGGGPAWHTGSTVPAGSSTGGTRATLASGLTGGTYSTAVSLETGGTRASTIALGVGGAGATGGFSGTGVNLSTGGVQPMGGSRATGGNQSTGGRLGTGGTTAAECNSLINSGPPVNVVSIADDAPTPTGGTITNGVYYLTAYELHTGVGGSTITGDVTMASTVALSNCSSSGCAVQIIMSASVSGTSLTAEGTGTISTTGITYETQFTCATDNAPGATGSYSASASEFSLIDDSTVAVYTLQLR